MSSASRRSGMDSNLRRCAALNVRTNFCLPNWDCSVRRRPRRSCLGAQAEGRGRWQLALGDLKVLVTIRKRGLRVIPVLAWYQI